MEITVGCGEELRVQLIDAADVSVPRALLADVREALSDNVHLRSERVRALVVALSRLLAE